VFFADLDYWATSRRGWLHRVPVAVKLAWLALVVASLVVVYNVYVYAGALAFLVAALLTSRLPIGRLLAAAAFPLLFLAVLFLSIRGLAWNAAAFFAARLLTIALSVLLLMATTPFPRLLAALRFLPRPLVAGLFLTYRAAFILAEVVGDVRAAYRLRGAPGWRRPLRAAANLGRAGGFVVMTAMERAERAAAALAARGFTGRVWL
jgi:energy-coupling factor transporter transmembrane protein EcfT